MLAIQTSFESKANQPHNAAQKKGELPSVVPCAPSSPVHPVVYDLSTLKKLQTTSLPTQSIPQHERLAEMTRVLQSSSPIWTSTSSPVSMVLSAFPQHAQSSPIAAGLDPSLMRSVGGLPPLTMDMFPASDWKPSTPSCAVRITDPSKAKAALRPDATAFVPSTAPVPIGQAGPLSPAKPVPASLNACAAALPTKPDSCALPPNLPRWARPKSSIEPGADTPIWRRNASPITRASPSPMSINAPSWRRTDQMSLASSDGEEAKMEVYRATRGTPHQTPIAPISASLSAMSIGDPMWNIRGQSPASAMLLGATPMRTEKLQYK